MAETVLVTGGTGFIAGWCIVTLLERGYRVRTTVRSLDRAAGVGAAIAARIDPGDRLTFHAADLTDDAGWDEAVAGCTHVLHVASPLGTDSPKDAQILIRPARDGTLRVLAAAQRAGVRRVVVTSSVAAVGGIGTDDILDETHWTDLDHIVGNHAYRQAKTLAERAAWDFAAQHPGFELVTVLPSIVLGPVLTRANLGSVQIVDRLISGKIPGNPRLGFTIVDVRDVADLHLRAMTMPEAAGERFLATHRFLWMREISAILRERLGDRAARVPTRSLPDFVLRFLSVFDRPLRYVTPGLGKRNSYVSAKAQRVLGWQPRAVEETLVDCAESLLATS